MNFDNVQNPETLPDDLIGAMFAHQAQLMVKYDEIERANGITIVPVAPFHIDNQLVQYRVKDFFWRMTEELAEAVDCMPEQGYLRRWRELKMWSVCGHFFEEMADALHFLVEASIYASFEPREVNEIYDTIMPHAGHAPMVSDQRIREVMFQIITSAGLAANCLKNKAWKVSQMPTDVTVFHRCLSRVWTNMLILWSLLDCSLQDIYLCYHRKNQVNQWRQKTRY